MIYLGRELDVVALWESLGADFGQVSYPLPSYLDKIVCMNPAHDTHKRHMQVNTKKPLVHCFARCGISGSYEHAISIILGISEKEARKAILKHTRAAIGVDVASQFVGSGKRKTFAADDPVAIDERGLTGGAFQYLPSEVRAYLDARGIDEVSRSKWQLGWHEDEERLVIPAFDDRGVFRFLIKRSLTAGGSFKYLYTEGAIKTSLLFGACHLDRSAVRSSGLVLCEGSLDAIRLHQLGVPNAVACLGSGLSKKQVRLIDKFNPRRVYLFFDKDSAGVDNIKDAKLKIVKRPLLVVRFPKHRSDPAEMTGEEVERALGRAIPIHEFFRKARTQQRTGKVVTA